MAAIEEDSVVSNPVEKQDLVAISDRKIEGQTLAKRMTKKERFALLVKVGGYSSEAIAQLENLRIERTSKTSKVYQQGAFDSNQRTTKVFQAQRKK